MFPTWHIDAYLELLKCVELVLYVLLDLDIDRLEGRLVVTMLARIIVNEQGFESTSLTIMNHPSRLEGSDLTKCAGV